METASWRDRVDAILVAWQPGEEGGNSIADVLTGKVNPSGKLTMTWPIACTDHPSTKNFPQEWDMYSYKSMQDNRQPIKGVDFSNHEEDIYVGYRYFDTFGKEVAYPFGYGLSYTTFDYSKPSVDVKDDRIEVSITVKNTGKTAGKEIVQVYAIAPKGNIEKPSHELKAFAKTRLLKPGERETLKMTISRRDLASFDEQNSRWLTDGGIYTFEIGASSRDIRETVRAKVSSYTEKVNDVIKPQVSLNLLKQHQ